MGVRLCVKVFSFRFLSVLWLVELVLSVREGYL